MSIKYFLICIFLCATSIINAQQSSLMQQAEATMRQGNYEEAGLLFERVLFESPAQDVAYAATLGKLACLKEQQLYAEAERYIAARHNAYFTDKMKRALDVQRIICAYMAGQFENVISLEIQLAALVSGESLPVILSVLKILSYNELGRWKEAEVAWLDWAAATGYAGENPYSEKPRYKSVSKAEWLSTIIPGGGQIYAGKPWEGITSILIQGGGLAFGVVSFLDKFYLSAWAGVGIFGSFHMGGVRRSAVLVNQYNKDKLYKFNERLKEMMLE